MAASTSALVVFTLPPVFEDGKTPWPAANYGGATIFRDGTQVGVVAAPTLQYTDTNIPAGVHAYTVVVKDKTSGLSSDPSAPVSYTQANLKPAAPVITSIVAA